MAAAVYLGEFEVGSPKWVEARANGLGGSEIAAVLGLSPWESRFSLWHRKAGLASPVVDNDLLEWGRRLERCIAEKFVDEHPDDMWVEPTGMWRSVERPWQIASPDRLIYPLVLDTDEQSPSGILECKTARDDLGWGEPGTDEVPVYYRAQALWYLDALGLGTCHLSVLIGGSDYREYRIEASPDEAALMRSAAQEFLDTLRAGIRPDLDGHSATYQLVREQHPDIDGEDAELPGAVAKAYLAALDGFVEAEDAKRVAAAAVLDAMGSARCAMWKGQHLATRIPGRGEDSPPYLRAVPRKETGKRVSAA